MTLELPTDAQVKQAMDDVLAEAARTGRTATVTAVERRLGLRHATFYRHYQPLITDYFRPKAQVGSQPAATTAADAENDRTMKRLRQENTELRKLTNIYAETIRQLTIDKTALEAQVQALSGVTQLRPRG
ncbi:MULTISPECIES: hypothetical protein [Streptomyces]|uniref:Uncharacterized protein n=1 Tax=Streptomyces albus (strain ATCC 21838 / DSM 41398 / FERM P-419 / JCM 4703 / NBRC 107858) TaxID=1081613 RepID=A0A0B5EKE9_STRA4|nr:hypothetical protein [Streptomyces sp. e14]AJE82004.1 hypothetical protein SLNWT_1628 [Streptomyces albus]AOU76322.1 hypothetical protein SLNHY_1631 [Streptomyces albus]AYN32107.1 hypothetical protein DUI70_1604 [Streptomyces albus]